MKNKFYITTPIYYPSGKFHIGTAYTTVLAVEKKTKETVEKDTETQEGFIDKFIDLFRP